MTALESAGNSRVKILLEEPVKKPEVIRRILL
jgi:hypothetical protein